MVRARRWWVACPWSRPPTRPTSPRNSPSAGQCCTAAPSCPPASAEVVVVATGDRTELGRISVELRLEPRPQREPAEAEAEVASGLGRAARRSGRPLGHKLSVPRASPTTRGTATVRHVTRPPSDGPILHREARTRLHFVDRQAFIRVAQTSPQPAPRSAPTGLHPLTPSSPPRSRARRWSSGSRPTSTPGSETGAHHVLAPFITADGRVEAPFESNLVVAHRS
jgi:hypothetical protein